MSCIINGSAGLTTNSGAVYDGISSGTSVTASGTSVDFTSIPSWVKRITVMLSGVSVNGTSLIQVQIGSGSVTTSGYASYFSTNGLSGTITSGFYTSYRGDAANALRGNVVITNISTNNYVAMGVVGGGASEYDVTSSTGSIALGGTLDRIRITTVNGTNTFDAGSINILFE
jgi:hypothetical protein